VLLLKYGSILSSLSYPKLVLEPWLERGALPIVRSQASSHVPRNSLCWKVIDGALRSSSPLRRGARSPCSRGTPNLAGVNAEPRTTGQGTSGVAQPDSNSGVLRDKVVSEAHGAVAASGDKDNTRARLSLSRKLLCPDFAKAAGMEGAV